MVNHKVNILLYVNNTERYLRKRSNAKNEWKMHAIGDQMTDGYKKNFIDQVILRIDFPSTPLEIKDKLPKELLDVILPIFPVSEKRDIIGKGVTFKKEADKDIDIQIEPSEITLERTYFNETKKKLLCISESYLFFAYKEWGDETFEEIKGIFHNLIDILFSKYDIKVTRLGLRYVNLIEFPPNDPTNWRDYLNDDLISIFNMSDDSSQISRAFQDLQLVISDMRLRFQYGMHNPDYPSVIKKKIFVLDYDGYYESLQGQKELEDNLLTINAEIKKIFKKSIGPKLEEIMVRGDSNGK